MSPVFYTDLCLLPNGRNWRITIFFYIFVKYAHYMRIPVDAKVQP